MNKAFTLIELIAVIIITAVIAMITTVATLDIIDKARKEAFRDTAYGLIDATRNYLMENMLKSGGITKEATFDFPTADGLNFQGEKPIGGKIKLNSKGQIDVAVYNSKWCALKSYDEAKVTIVNGICPGYENGEDNTCPLGSMRLNLYYPTNSVNKEWRLNKLGIIRNTDELKWKEYTGPICVKLADVENIWIRYNAVTESDYEQKIIPPVGELLIDITHQKTNDFLAIVKIDFDNEAINKEYRVGNSGWLPYDGEFNITENTIIYARAKKDVFIKNSNDEIIDTATITGYDIYEISDLGIKEIDESLDSPTINLIDTDDVPNVEIIYPNEEITKIFKINSGEEQNYSGILTNLNWGDSIKAYYYTQNGKKSKEVVKTLDKNPDDLDVDIIADPEPALVFNLSKTKITIIYDDDAINKEYQINNGEKIAYTGPFDIMENCTINAYASAVNKSGEASKNITFKKSLLNSPVINVNYNNDKTKATISITYDEENGITKKYSINGDSLLDYSMPFDITENGTVIYAENADSLGNIKNTTYTLTGLNSGGSEEQNLDTPVINVSYNNDKTKATVSITYDEENGITKKYSINGGSLLDYSMPFDITENGMVIYAENADSLGNIKSSTYTVTDLNGGGSEEQNLNAPIIKVSYDSDYSKALVSIIYDEENGTTRKYNINGGNLLDYSMPFDITENGTVIYAENADNLGNIKSSTYTITGIIKKLDISISVNPDTPEVTITEATITINYDSNSTKKMYKINGGALIDYTGTFTINEKSTITAIAESDDGYGEATKAINNFAVGLNSPIVSYTKVASTGGEIAKVSIEYDSNATTKKYSINDGQILDYTGIFDVNNNGTTINAYSYDDFGHYSNTSIVIDDLKKFTYVEYEKYFIVKLNYPENSINNEYKYSDNNWKLYNKDKGFILIKNEYKDDFDENSSIMVEDENGNIYDYKDDWYIVDVNNFNLLQADIYMRWDYKMENDPQYNQKQALQIISMPKETQTDKVYVLIIPQDNSTLTQYKINNDEYQNYMGTLTINDNNTTITARSLNSDGSWSNTVSYTITNIVNIPDYVDNSGANKPEIYNNMVPVKYNGTNWIYADIKEKWYDYDAKEWANTVVLVNSPSKTYNIGDSILMSDILQMYVWIPRYKYIVFNGNNGSATAQQINVTFENGTSSTGTVSCTDTVGGSSLSSETCTDRIYESITNGISTYTHPAFKFGDTNLNGIWIGKFETGNIKSCSGSTCDIATLGIQIKPNVNSWREASVSTFFVAINNMSTTYNLNVNSHMMKNMEWGAVAYLEASKYGLGTKEIGINNYYDSSSSSFKTGCGSASSSSSSTLCNSYDTTQGELASTTGNIYGIYDMSGGAQEYIMGNMVTTGNTPMVGYNSTYNSGFNGDLYSGTYSKGIDLPNIQYYDAYTNGSSKTTHSRGKLGDATKETLTTYGNTNGGWYSDYSQFPYSNYSWFIRGGPYGGTSSTGIFVFNYYDGSKYGSIGTRVVLTKINS